MTAALVVVTGRTQTGKTYLVARALKRESRVLVYDPKGRDGDFPGIEKFYSMADLAAALRAAGDGPGRFRLIDQGTRYFDLWSRAALVWGRDFGPCAVVADELSDVTHPGKAPPAWGRLCRTGVGFGITIYAITQRPAESDKTCFSNASVLITFHMMKASDRQYMASEMDIDRGRIDRLLEREYIAREPGGKIHVHTRPGNSKKS